MRIGMLVTLIASCVCLLGASAPPKQKEFYDPDVQKLIAVNVFVFGSVGPAGELSPGEQAFAAILKKSESIRFVLAAFDHGTPEAKCYALVALREMSDALYDTSELAVRKNPPASIYVRQGGEDKPLHPSKVLAAIDGGQYRKYYQAHAEDR
ncbi:hypothetical protein [Opitutus sp. ER46]|uniref:hypothetical protein n=1 Tax=Opitutus sp. ER46 TaxID=2161864 RepID=UPI000D30926F|nr:hypothetical protein [Opitutus sp. ER46]PTX96397.1 hypothetical protein DB354_06950 [Opitutus sp. ER46]